MRQGLRRRQTPVAAGCLLAALALALLSLVTGAQAARPGPPVLRAAVAQVGAALRTAEQGGTHLRAGAPAAPDGGTAPALPYALLPTALLLVAAAGFLARRAWRAERSVRPHRGVPTGRGPPGQALAA